MMPQTADVIVRRTGPYPQPAFGSATPSPPPIPMHSLLRTRDWAVIFGVVGYAALIAIWSASGVFRSGTMSVVHLLAQQAVTIVAGALAWDASRARSMDRGGRRFWLSICAMQALTLVLAVQIHLTSGSFVWTPLLSHVALLYGMMQLPSAPRDRLDRAKLLLDGLTVFVGGSLVFWYDYNAAVLHGAGGATPTLIFAHGAALAELVLILVASIMVRRTVLQHRANVLMVVSMALVVLFLAHVATVVGGMRGTSQNDWGATVAPVSTALLAVAAWLHRATISHREVRSSALSIHATEGTNIIAYAAVLPGFGLLLRASFEQGTQPLIGLAAGSVILAALAFARQVTSTRETVRALTESTARMSEARFSALVQHSSDVITILDPDGTIRYASPSMVAVLGHDPLKLVGTSIVGLLHPDDVGNAMRFLEELAHSARPDTVTQTPLSTMKHEWRLAHANGEWMTVDNVGTNLLTENVIQGLVLNTRDVTEQSEMKERYMHQAFHDPLTDLANRSLFLYQSGHALARASRSSKTVTVLFLDLDNFKTVNDSLGHAAGDRLLVDAARRLSACVRTSDLIARLGGDEFAVLVEDAEDVAEIQAIAERIEDSLKRPFVLSGKEVFVSASIGIARTSVGDSSDDLIRNADVAMYVAKSRGKGQYALFEPQMHAAALERLVVEADLRRAIDRDEFFLQYQPIVLLETGEVIGAEALVRWCCRERGTVPPGVFIPIAEETGLISAIGRWVLKRACRTAAQWERERGHPMRMTVNLSGRQLQEPTVVDDVRQALEESGLDARHLTLEITESTLMHNTELSMVQLTALKELGLTLAIDDFGTGYSSLSYLQRYPIDILKIDKAFVDVIDKGGEGPVLASAIIALGETLRMNTVAEGIETEDQRTQLMILGCELGQGYLFAPPLDAEEFWDILITRGARSYDTKRRRRVQGAQAA